MQSSLGAGSRVAMELPALLASEQGNAGTKVSYRTSFPEGGIFPHVQVAVSMLAPLMARQPFVS